MYFWRRFAISDIISRENYKAIRKREIKLKRIFLNFIWEIIKMVGIFLLNSSLFGVEVIKK